MPISTSPRSAISLVLAAVLAASCSDIPDLGGEISDRGRHTDYPNLEPIDALLARASAPSAATTDLDALAARAGGLRARAQRLRGPVLDQPTRARLLAALSRHS